MSSIGVAAYYPFLKRDSIGKILSKTDIIYFIPSFNYSIIYFLKILYNKIFNQIKRISN